MDETQTPAAPLPPRIYAEGEDPCVEATTHLLVVPGTFWFVEGFDRNDAADFGWGWEAPDTYLLPVHLEGEVRFPAELHSRVRPEWAGIYGFDWPEDDDWPDVLTCNSPDGFMEDPRTCTGRVFWMDNQGHYVCEGHTGGEVREVMP